MARKPNFDFERRERDRAKAAKSAQKAEAKKQKGSEIVATTETGSLTLDEAIAVEDAEAEKLDAQDRASKSAHQDP